MAPIRRFKRRQQPQQKKDAAGMGSEALSLLDAGAPTGEPQSESAMHLPRPEGKAPAGDGESSKPAQAEIGLEVEPGALFRFEALSLLSGNAPAVDVAATTALPERAKGDAAGKSSNPPPKPSISVAQAEMELQRVEPESGPTKQRLPPTAEDVEAVALQEKNRQPPSPPVPFEVPPVRGGSPRMSGGSTSTDPSPLPTQDQETDGLLKQIDDALHRVMEIRRCKMQQDLEADSLLEKSRDALKRVMAIRGGRSDAVKPSPLLAEEEIDQFGKNWGNEDEEIRRLEREEVALRHLNSLQQEEVVRYAKKFDSVCRELCEARADAQETKSTASAMALRSAHDKRLSYLPELRTISARSANHILSLLRTRRDLDMALTVKEATPVAGAVGLKRYPLLSAKLAEHLEEVEPEMLERCCLEMDAAQLQRLNDYFLKGEIAKLKAKHDMAITQIEGEAGIVFCSWVVEETTQKIRIMETLDLVRNPVAET